MDETFDVIAEAFSLTAERYDRFAENHPNLERMRGVVYRELERYLKPGAHILELNAGTGSDAVYLARHGFYVHATDIAAGMLKRMAEKVERLGLQERISMQECSFTELERIQGAPFDAIFSNLGGLNCIADLSLVVGKLPSLLRPDGVVTWVIMPPICLWELAFVFSGNIRFALRRLAQNGTLAHLEGRRFKVYYFTPHQVITALGAGFQLLSLQGLSVFAPPAESKNLAKRHPRLYAALCWLDERLANLPPFWGWGDFFILSMRYAPQQDRV